MLARSSILIHYNGMMQYIRWDTFHVMIHPRKNVLNVGLKASVPDHPCVHPILYSSIINILTTTHCSVSTAPPHMVLSPSPCLLYVCVLFVPVKWYQILVVRALRAYLHSREWRFSDLLCFFILVFASTRARIFYRANSFLSFALVDSAFRECSDKVFWSFTPLSKPFVPLESSSKLRSRSCIFQLIFGNCLLRSFHSHHRY